LSDVARLWSSVLRCSPPSLALFSAERPALFTAERPALFSTRCAAAHQRCASNNDFERDGYLVGGEEFAIRDCRAPD
jgi:hypothetical protein